MARSYVLELSAEDRMILEGVLARPSSPAGLARRARVVLLSAEGLSGVEIARRLGLTPEHVCRVRRRFVELGVAGLSDRKKSGRKDHALPQATIERIVQLAMSPPPAGRTRWTTRLLAREVGHTSGTVSKVLQANGLKPHLSRTYKVSKDPEFAKKVRDVVGLYLNPPTNAVVLSVDEKTQIQALERTQLPLPLRSGRASRHTHDYKRHGVLDLYAALEVATGKVVHQCTERHTAVEFLAFMKKVVRAFPRRELHVILDNSSSHSTPAVKEWLAAHPRVKFHYTPTSASWLNQVEGFFGILGKQSLHLVDMPSKAALRRHIEAYLESWNANPTAFEWTKPAAALIRSHKRMLDRISGAVH